MSPREVIADALTRITLRYGALDAADWLLAVMTEAGIGTFDARTHVAVPRKAPDKWSAEHQKRWTAFLKSAVAAAEEQSR